MIRGIKMAVRPIKGRITVLCACGWISGSGRD